MITIWFFPIGTFDEAPRAFPIACPNIETARMVYDALVKDGCIAASTRP